MHDVTRTDGFEEVLGGMLVHRRHRKPGRQDTAQAQIALGLDRLKPTLTLGTLGCIPEQVPIRRCAQRLPRARLTVGHHCGAPTSGAPNYDGDEAISQHGRSLRECSRANPTL